MHSWLGVLWGFFVLVLGGFCGHFFFLFWLVGWLGFGFFGWLVWFLGCFFLVDKYKEMQQFHFPNL